MDVLITLHHKDNEFNIYILYGSGDSLNCSIPDKPVISKMKGEPLALDYNNDFIIDLFGVVERDNEEKRIFWIFKNRTEPEEIEMKKRSETLGKIRIPHSHAVLDLNDDFIADLVISCEKGYEIWEGQLDSEVRFKYNHTVMFPEKSASWSLFAHDPIFGQAIFADIELRGEFKQLVPTCWDSSCHNASFLVSGMNSFYNLPINMKDDDGNLWGFALPKDDLYENAMSVRVGDFNLDGYPDLLATLENVHREKQVFLLENIQCSRPCPISRTFAVKWKALSPFTKGTIQGSFFDFYQHGILDVILVEKYNKNQYRPLAFRNSLDYDVNFVKVIVLTGLSNERRPSATTPLGYRRRYYGTNLPGPRIEFKTTTQEGEKQHGASPQLSQSAYFSLQLPTTIFGLGRTPNFVDSLTVGLSGKEKTMLQLIPNSQMIIVPSPFEQPEKWKAQLFVTPSKLILMSVLALSGICLAILIIIMILHFKEKREDKLEKLAEAHRFHFDAM